MKRNSSVLVIFLLFVINASFAQKYSTGLRKDTIVYNRSAKKEYAALRDALPTSFDLKKFMPSIGDQDTLGSCTAWACVYYGLTIVKGIEKGVKHPAFSPLSVYNRHKFEEDEDPCSFGADIYKVLDFLKLKGAPLSRDYLHAEYCTYDYDYKRYDERLYKKEYIRINQTQFKRALAAYSPIIIAMDCYKKGTNEDNMTYSLGSNMVSPSGEWLFGSKYGWQEDGAHAMTIIGYDDNKFGGAFLVANSWDSDWGEDGFFWVKYSQLQHVYNAYAMVPSRISPNILNVQDNQESYDGYKTKELKFTNNCKNGAFVALAQETGSGFLATGWYFVGPYKEVTLDISNRFSNSVYWMADMEHKDGYAWNGSDKYFCTSNEAFDFLESRSCSNKKGFYKYTPSNYNTTEGQSISCPNVRGEGQLISFKVVDGDPIELNRNWDGTYPLKDIVSDKVIVMDVTSEEIYDVYLLDEKGKISQSKLSKFELQNKSELKFTSLINAENYKKSLNKR